MLTAGVFFLMFFSNLRTRDIEGDPSALEVPILAA